MADPVSAQDNQTNQQQAAQPNAGDGQQVQVPQAQDDSQFVRVDRRNFAPYAPDGDFNKVIHLAKGYNEAKELCKEYGFDDPTAFLKALKAQDGQQAQQSQVQQQQAVQSQQGQEDPLAKPLTARDLMAFQDQLSQREQEVAWRRQYESDLTVATNTTKAAISELVGEGKLVKLMFNGAEREVNVTERQVKGVFREMLDEVLDEAYAGNPHAAQMKQWPATPDQIKEAASRAKALLSVGGTTSAERTADSQKKFPNAGLGAGGGGRASKDPREMTPAELEAETFRRARAKGKIT